MLLLFEGEDAIRKIFEVTGSIRQHWLNGQTIRDTYGDTVKVYQMGEGDRRASFEICGGPHADHTGQLSQNDDGTPNGKRFKITKEESSSAGIRRVKGVLA
jgi:alanyl-tRNA synthetase